MPRVAVLAARGPVLDQRKAANERAIAHCLKRPQILRLRRGARIQLLGGDPRSAGLAHKVSITGSADPVPALRCDHAKPRCPKAGIGQHDGRPAIGRQDRRQSLDELSMHPSCAQVMPGMNFFVERDAATLHHHGCAQPVPLEVSRETGPVDHDQKLWQPAEPRVRQGAIHGGTLDVQVGVGEQPIHAFDSVTQRRMAQRAQGQRAQRQGAAVHRRHRHIAKRLPSRGMHQWLTTSQQSRYDELGLHGLFSLFAWSLTRKRSGHCRPRFYAKTNRQPHDSQQGIVGKPQGQTPISALPVRGLANTRPRMSPCEYSQRPRASPANIHP